MAVYCCWPGWSSHFYNSTYFCSEICIIFGWCLVKDVTLNHQLEDIFNQMIEHNEFSHTIKVKDKPCSDEGASEKNQILDLSVFNVLKGLFGDAFKNAVENHTNSTKDNIKKIEKALNTGDLKELERAAHSLKGAAAQFGAVTLSAIAEKLEQFAEDADIEKAKNLFSQLKTAREKVESEMLKVQSE